MSIHKGLLYCDLETYSEIELKTCGGYKYSEAVEILLFAYGVEEGPVNVWDVTSGARCPSELYDRWCDDRFFKTFHNSMFDRVMINATGILPRQPVERYIDTMVWAMSHGLPGGLDMLCQILGIPEELAKHKTGKKLVPFFTRPRPKNQKLRRATRHTHPVEWEQFIAYAGGDISAMRAIIPKLPRINYPLHPGERALWVWDQRMNDRGIPIDRRLALKALEAADYAKADYAEQTQELTDGELQAATQRDALLKYILEQFGVDLPDMQAATLERRLNDETLPAEVKELIAIRLESSTTSTSKYKRLLQATGKDGRLRGCIQFSGATRTHRDAGRLFQPQNLKRPDMKQEEIDFYTQATLNSTLHLVCDKPMKALSNMTRGVIVAPPGRKLVVSDLSNIEGRGGAWLAGEKWKLKAFYDYDTFLFDEKGERIPDGKGDFLRVGKDLYILTYARSFAVDPDTVDKEQRQVGKVQELAFLYGGGVGAWVTFALLYRVNLDELAEKAWHTIPDTVLSRAKSNYAWTVQQRRTTHGLAQKTWIVCEALKLAWREAHPNVVQLWDELENAAKSAIINKGQRFKAGKYISFSANNSWLFMHMPNGTALCYPQPQISDKGDITYMGINQYSRKWQRLKTYGGKILENGNQKLSRDRMFYNIPQIEKAGYDIILRVHDELITETPDTPDYNVGALSSMLAANQEWAQGFPTSAAGFECYRYKKG